MGMGGQCHAVAALLPGKTQNPLYRSLGGPQGQYGWVQNISPPLGFDPRANPACSESLYHLCYPGPYTYSTNSNKIEI
jgi:hypothetical protein